MNCKIVKFIIRYIEKDLCQKDNFEIYFIYFDKYNWTI